jgi:alkanesulfonate monooxygenase SsuD/methylene tetrahydromethanopterin reductase-like flavin-dependent oxidoreductase (luciferase family)
MRFGVFFEIQLPRPWDETSEERAFAEALEQAVLADKLGIQYMWATEHHFLEEYAHSSAPEVFLAAAAALTTNIRIGHGIRLMPPKYNHPARVAEALATLDLISHGRVEWGVGSSSSAAEILGFEFDPHDKEAMADEATREVAKMLCTSPYPGYSGEFFSMPARNIVPKPAQKPHPPLWTACSKRATILRAAEQGIGALTFSFVNPLEAKGWVEDYHRTFEEGCQPIGQDVNPRIDMVTGFGCHEDPAVARQRFKGGQDFFGFALAYYYGNGRHVPGIDDIWKKFIESGDEGDTGYGDATPFSNPADLRERYKIYEDAGVDQVVLLPQAGRNRHEDICEALELFGTTILPEFIERDEEAEKRRSVRLAPAIEKARRRIADPAGTQAPDPIEAFGLRSKRAASELSVLLQKTKAEDV